MYSILVSEAVSELKKNEQMVNKIVYCWYEEAYSFQYLVAGSADYSPFQLFAYQSPSQGKRGNQHVGIRDAGL
jgi:hypothetical protein